MIVDLHEDIAGYLMANGSVENDYSKGIPGNELIFKYKKADVGLVVA